MKHYVRLAIVGFAGIVIGAAGQQTDFATRPNEPAESLPKPEFSNVFFRLMNGNLIPLERQTATMHVHAGGFILYDATGVGEIPGPRSSVRFQHVNKFELVVRCPAGLADEDPQTLYHLRVLRTKKRTREWVFLSADSVGAVHTSVKIGSDSMVPTEWSKRPGNLLVMNAGSLPPGEYVVGKIQAGATAAVFCFGVD
jgi:hypothetical protein